MIHHISVGSRHIPTARAFYDPVLGHLGITLLAVSDRAADYGVTDIVFSVETPVNGAPATAGNGSHVAFQAKDEAAVQEFHRLAMLNGGSDGGAPGPRPEYGPDYYAAFILDPDGNKIEAVCPPTAASQSSATSHA